MNEDEEVGFESEDEENVTDGTPFSYKWTREHATMDLLEYAAALQAVTAQYFSVVTMRAAAHSNRKVDERTMWAQASQEIESLTGGGNGEA